MKNNKKMFYCSVKKILFFYIICVLYILLRPITANAAENAPGGANNKVSIRSQYTVVSTGKKTIESYDFTMSDDFEAIGFLQYLNDRVILTVTFCKNGKGYTNSNVSYADALGMLNDYDTDGKLLRSNVYDKGNFLDISIPYKTLNPDLLTVLLSVSGMKIFQDVDAAREYISSGILDGMVNEDDVESGVYDPEIGYLHNLKHYDLTYGERDANGFYSSYDDRFTWSDYYPEYDDSYMVEVRVSCEVEVKKWFGVGKSNVYNSNIRELATGIPYKDLEYIVSLSDQKSLFSDFINKYMPGNDTVSDVISAGSFRFDTYYFRIYRWDEETESFKYGQWVRLTKDGSALLPTLGTTVDAGDFDDDGNWIKDSDSDYGDGKHDQTFVGEGDDMDSAKDDADQTEKESGNKQIDLSNTNFKELWEWFTGVLIDFWNGLGALPDFFARLFSFLPSPVIALIAGSIFIALVLRILGR